MRPILAIFPVTILFGQHINQCRNYIVSCGGSPSMHGLCVNVSQVFILPRFTLNIDSRQGYFHGIKHATFTINIIENFCLIRHAYSLYTLMQVF